MSKALAVLIIENSQTDAGPVIRELRRSGFSPEWERVETAAALRNALRSREWSVVIADSSVRRLDVFDALALVREEAPAIPFIVVSAMTSEDAVVQAIRSGANDYVTLDNLGRLGGAVARELASIAPDMPSARRLLEVREAERRRVAHELHDQIGQLLVAVRLNVLAAQQRTAKARAHALAEAKALVDDCIGRVREFSSDLYPAVLDEGGLGPALERLARRQARWSALYLEVEIGAVPPLPRAVEAACFSVAQEALTNVCRHAEARSVRLECRVRDGALELLVADDGNGFDVQAARRHAAAGANLGLSGMHQRVMLAGGRLEVESAARRGTKVRARFPIVRRAAR